MRLILASGSAARQHMLRQAGVKFSTIPADIDEAALKRGFSGSPAQLALALAAAKAAMVAKSHAPALVIGADQLLVCGETYFSKPENLGQVATQLRALSGQTHTLITAVSVLQGEQTLWSHVAEARLTMRELSEDFIANYLAAEGEAVLGCVGAYRLEGLGAQLFDHIEGDFFTILGLNLLPLLGFLRGHGAIPA